MLERRPVYVTWGGGGGSSRVAHPGNPSTEMEQGGRRCLWERQLLSRSGWGSGQAFPLLPLLCKPQGSQLHPPMVDQEARALCWGPSFKSHPRDSQAPHQPHLMRIPVGRASSSLVFLRFCSASSEDLGQSRVRGTATAPQQRLPHSHPTHARKSFTSSTVMSPVVSSGVSRLLLGESMGPGEKAAGCSSGDPRESQDRRDWGLPGLEQGCGTRCVCRDRVGTHGRCRRASAGPRSCGGRGCRSPAAASVSPLSCCCKETGRSYGQNHVMGWVHRGSTAAKPPTPPRQPT